MKNEKNCGYSGVPFIDHCPKCAFGCYVSCEIFKDKMASEKIIRIETKLLGPGGRDVMLGLIEAGYLPMKEYAGYLYKDEDGIRTIMAPDYNGGYIVRSKKPVKKMTLKERKPIVIAQWGNRVLLTGKQKTEFLLDYLRVDGTKETLYHKFPGIKEKVQQFLIEKESQATEDERTEMWTRDKLSDILDNLNSYLQI